MQWIYQPLLNRILFGTEIVFAVFSLAILAGKITENWHRIGYPEPQDPFRILAVFWAVTAEILYCLLSLYWAEVWAVAA